MSIHFVDDALAALFTQNLHGVQALRLFRQFKQRVIRIQRLWRAWKATIAARADGVALLWQQLEHALHRQRRASKRREILDASWQTSVAQVLQRILRRGSAHGANAALLKPRTVSQQCVLLHALQWLPVIIG